MMSCLSLLNVRNWGSTKLPCELISRRPLGRLNIPCESGNLNRLRHAYKQLAVASGIPCHDRKTVCFSKGLLCCAPKSARARNLVISTRALKTTKT